MHMRGGTDQNQPFLTSRTNVKGTSVRRRVRDDPQRRLGAGERVCERIGEREADNMTTVDIGGVAVVFPFEPYPIQIDYMAKVISCCQEVSLIREEFMFQNMTLVFPVRANTGFWSRPLGRGRRCPCSVRHWPG